MGAISLLLFGWLLAQHAVSDADRIYAAYGGIYIAVSMLWLWQVEGYRPTLWDLCGGTICLIGATVISGFKFPLAALQGIPVANPMPGGMRAVASFF